MKDFRVNLVFQMTSKWAVSGECWACEDIDNDRPYQAQNLNWSCRILSSDLPEYWWCWLNLERDQIDSQLKQLRNMYQVYVVLDEKFKTFGNLSTPGSKVFYSAHGKFHFFFFKSIRNFAANHGCRKKNISRVKGWSLINGFSGSGAWNRKKIFITMFQHRRVTAFQPGSPIRHQVFIQMSLLPSIS